MLSKQSRYEARYDTQYDTGYESGPGPELRSLDQLIELKLRIRAERKESRHKVGLKSRRLRTRITPEISSKITN
jgi:hypothetical protein